MRLKNTPTQTTQTLPTSYSTSVPVSQSTVTPTVAQTQARQYTPRPRRRLLARVALWACFLTPLVAMGSQVPQWLFLQRPEVRESLLVPPGFEAVSSSFSPDGQTLAMVVSKQYPKNYSGGILPTYVSFWNWRTRKEIGPKVPLKTWATPLIWRKGGKELLLPGSVSFLVDQESGAVSQLASDISLATSPDGTRMIRSRPQDYRRVPMPGGHGYSLEPTSYSVADVDTSKVLYKLKLPEGHEPNFMHRWSFSPDNLYITLTEPPQGGSTGTLLCWKVGQEEPLWQVGSLGNQAAAFDPNGKRLYSIIKDNSQSGTMHYGDQHLACLDLTTGKKLWSTQAMLTWDENMLVQGGRVFLNANNGIRVFDAATGKQVLELRDDVVDFHGFSEPKIALSPDGKMLAERHEFGIRLRPLAGEKGVP